MRWRPSAARQQLIQVGDEILVRQRTRDPQSLELAVHRPADDERGRAVDPEGDVLGVLVQTRRNTWAALKLMRKFKKKYGFAPDNLVTDDL